MKTNKTNGFTLIELLVVIAIIALLLSVVAPALKKAKNAARKLVCATNLHQVTLGVRAYTSDNNGKLPIYTLSDKPAPTSLYHNNQVNLWGEEDTLGGQEKERKLTRYIEKGVGKCPLDKGYQPGSSVDGTFYVDGNFHEVYGSSYMYNNGILDPVNGRSISSLGEPWSFVVTEVLYNKKIEDIKESYKTVMVSDRTMMCAEYPLCRLDYFAYTKMHSQTNYELNIGFVDGHVNKCEVLPEPDNLKNQYYNLVLVDYDEHK
ncbi:MAG: type II secretion system protein [Planctomycetota bacterium]|nr:type II secretion system protein [Planctomycetota bacterium]